MSAELKNLEDDLSAFILDEFMFGEGEVPVDVDLFEEGILDSMSFLQLLEHFRVRYGVEVEMADITLDGFRTVQKAARYLASHGART